MRNLPESWRLLVARLYSLVTNQRAQTLAEYSLILSLIAVGVVLPTLLLFRAEMAAAFNSATNCLDGTC